MEDKYVRTMSELEKYACMWWPKEVREYADKISILQYLLDTQEKFISILKLASKTDTESIFKIIDACGFSYFLFLKHLMILTGATNKTLNVLNRKYNSLCVNDEINSSLAKAEVSNCLPIKEYINDELLMSDSQLCKELVALLIYSDEEKLNEVKHVMTLSSPLMRQEYEKKLTLNFNEFIKGKTIWDSIKDKIYKLCA